MKQIALYTCHLRESASISHLVVGDINPTHIEIISLA